MVSKVKEDKIKRFIKNQVNVDIAPYIDKKNSTSRYINLDWNDMSHSEQNAIKRLATMYGGKNYSLADNGGLGMAMFVK